MARKYHAALRSGHTILVIDDVPEVLESTRQLLEAEGHRVLTAPDGPTGVGVAAREHPHLILCDYFMPGMTGEEVVREVRVRDKLAQIILVTGYAGEKPARVMMQQLDIQGYHDKGEGADRLLLWVDVALKAYRSALAAEKHRIGLQYILDITPDLHRLQPVDELLHGLLWQVEGLVGAENSFLATFPGTSASTSEDGQMEGFVAILDENSSRTTMEIRVGTGRFRPGIPTDSLPEPERSLVSEAIQSGVVSFNSGVSVLPLRLGDQVLGSIFIDRRPGFERDRELLEIFASQAAAAIRSALLYGQNAQLYALATRDQMTGVYLRGYAMQQFQQALKRSHRNGLPISVLMVDLDKFKQINDTYGHIVGDDALRAVGKLLQTAVRDTDFVGRYGGDEFMIVLGDTPPAGVEVVGQRILELARGLHVEHEGVQIPLRLSIGGGTLLPMPATTQFQVLRTEFVEKVAAELIDAADGALYSTKGTGKLGDVRILAWRDLLQSLAA